MGHASQPGADAPGTATSDAAVRAVVTGAAQFSSLDAAQRAAAHELIDGGIAKRAAAERFGEAGDEPTSS